jgi:HlyD family secretion protein
LADLEEKQQTYEEDLELYDAKAISRHDLDRAKRDVKRAEIDLLTAQAQLEETKIQGNKSARQQARSEFICAEIEFRDAEEAMKHKEIVAPCTGIVTIEKQGSTATGEAVNKAVSENRNVSPGDILMTVEDRSRLAVAVRLNEYDVYNIREGQSCMISIPALPGQPFPGRVVSISPKSSDREESFFQMICQIDQINPPLKFGMSAYVQLLLKERKNVLFVPTSALVTKDMRTGVYVPGKVEPEFYPVRIGIKNYDVAEILDGLTEGLQILCRVPASLLVSGGSAGGAGAPPRMPGLRPPSGGPKPSGMRGRPMPPQRMPRAAPPAGNRTSPPDVS